MWHAGREEDWFTVVVMSDVIFVVRDDPYDPNIKVQTIARYARSVLDYCTCWHIYLIEH